MSNQKDLNKKTGHVISHTHWDREWRVPEWNSRFRLSKMMDRLLEKLQKDPDFTFLFDGQVVSIEDYLDICPERKREVCDLIKADRIQIGPWYNLPDTYPVCGEALVRNLLTGIKKANEMGNCLDIAYTTFGWGQTAQFPQIYDNFGIKRIVCAKNVSKERAPNSEFMWQSPDGTGVFTTRLGVEKRANFFFFTLMPALYGYDYSGNRTRIRWGKNGWFFHSASENTDSEITFMPEFAYHPEMIENAISDSWDTTKDSVIDDHVFMGNGCDSTAPSDAVDKIISDVNKIFKNKKLKYSTLKEYFDHLQESIENKGIELKTVYGELRDGPAAITSANALATRMPLKKLNREAQKSLIRYAEPFAALVQTLGIEHNKTFIEKAWKFLLLAHSHDALNGVTLDKTARDTANKFEQVIELSQMTTDSISCEIIKQVDLSEYDKEDILLAVFNPTPTPKDQIVHLEIDVPQEESSRILGVEDGKNRKLLCQPISHFSHQAPVYVQNSRALPFYADRHKMYIKTGDIPAYGYKILKLVPEMKYNRKIQYWHHRYEYGSQICGPLSMQNEYLKVQFNSDGTFDIYDKINEREYKEVGYFEDSGDAGDYWQRVKPEFDKVLYSKGREANIYVKEDGPLVTSIVAETVLNVPKFTSKTERFQNVRADETTEIKTLTCVTLKKDTPFLQVDIEIENTAEDHRLRFCVPTNMDTEKSDSMGHFNVDSRKIERPLQSGSRDAEMGTLPMQNFIDLSDNKSGLAVLSNDITEFEVSEDTTGTLFLTLLRCMDVRICTEGRCGTKESGAKGPQCLGKHKYSIALFPHKGNWEKGNVYSAMEKFVYKPKVYQISAHDKGSKPVKSSFLEIQNENIQLAAVKTSEDGKAIILRIYNPTKNSQKTKISFAKKVKKSCLVNMKEEVISEIPVNENVDITLKIDTCKINSIRVEF